MNQKMYNITRMVTTKKRKCFKTLFSSLILFFTHDSWLFLNWNFDKVNRVLIFSLSFVKKYHDECANDLYHEINKIFAFYEWIWWNWESDMVRWSIKNFDSIWNWIPQCLEFRLFYPFQIVFIELDSFRKNKTKVNFVIQKKTCWYKHNIQTSIELSKCGYPQLMEENVMKILLR